MLTQSIPALLARYDRLELRFLLLTLVLCVMLGGVFPVLVARYGHSVDLGVWLLVWILLATFWVELPLFHLLRPAAPLVAWLLFYIGWGIMAAAYPIFDEGYRLAFRFLSIVAAMAVVTSRPGRLRVFADAVQWVLVVNLAVAVLLMARPGYRSLALFEGLDLESGGDRFAGIWGNANLAGLVSLMVLVLSRWASRWQARIGRISGLVIIYLTASRTAAWILVALGLLYLAFAATRRVRLNVLALAVVLAVAGWFALKSSGNDLDAMLASNPTVARVLDVQEARTEEAGGGSRREVLQDWLRMVPSEPWYGYGLYTLFGAEGDESVARPGFPAIGPHNLYLGIFLDVGGLGLAAFLAILLYQIRTIRRLPLIPSARHALFAFCLLLLVFSNFNHNMLTGYAGWMAFSLMFLLPASPALVGQRFRTRGTLADDRR